MKGDAPLPVAAQPQESAETLIERGKALLAQQRSEEALPLFERASQIAPRSMDAWSNLGATLNVLNRSHEALKSQPSKWTGSRRFLLASLAGLAITGSGMTAWFALSQPLKTSSPSLHPTPTSVPLGKIIFKYPGHSNSVFGVAWSADSKRVASGSSDKTVQIWDAPNGKHVLTYPGGAGSVSWSPDGKNIAYASDDKTVHIRDATTGNHILTYLEHLSTVIDVAWSPDGKSIASSDANSTIQVWDSSTGNTLFTCHSTLQFVGSVAWSPDNKRIASRSAASPVSPADANVQVWDTTFNGSLVYTQVDHNSTGGSVAWSPNGKYLAAGNSDPSPQTIVRVLDATTGNSIFTYRGHTLGVNGLAWSPDGTYVASGSYDKTVQIWNAMGSGVLINKSFPDSIFGIAWSPNGAFIASGGGGNNHPQDYKVYVWAA